MKYLDILGQRHVTQLCVDLLKPLLVQMNYDVHGALCGLAVAKLSRALALAETGKLTQLQEEESPLPFWGQITCGDMCSTKLCFGATYASVCRSKSGQDIITKDRALECSKDLVYLFQNAPLPHPTVSATPDFLTGNTARYDTVGVATTEKDDTPNRPHGIDSSILLGALLTVNSPVVLVVHSTNTNIHLYKLTVAEEDELDLLEGHYCVSSAYSLKPRDDKEQRTINELFHSIPKPSFKVDDSERTEIDMTEDNILGKDKDISKYFAALWETADRLAFEYSKWGMEQLLDQDPQMPNRTSKKQTYREGESDQMLNKLGHYLFVLDKKKLTKRIGYHKQLYVAQQTGGNLPTIPPSPLTDTVNPGYNKQEMKALMNTLLKEQVLCCEASEVFDMLTNTKIAELSKVLLAAIGNLRGKPSELELVKTISMFFNWNEHPRHA